MSIEQFGLVLAGLGFVFAFGAKVLEFVLRFFVDRSIASKEKTADEAAKNSTASLDEYRKLKREYDANKGKK